MYFNNLETIPYPFIIHDSDGNQTEVIKSIKNISQNVRIIKEIVDNITAYDYYIFQDGDTPHSISQKFYNTTDYWWIIMLVNNRFDYLNDFPLPDDVLEDYIDDKYGDKRTDVKFYYDKNGMVTNKDGAFVSKITNYDWEYKQNDEKRKMVIPSFTVVSKLVNQFKSAF